MRVAIQAAYLGPVPIVTVPAPVLRRVDRETQRAPLPAASELRTDVPSARPTRQPDLSIEALTQDYFEQTRQPGVPMDMVVPVRSEVPASGVDHRSAFLLLHVDGRSSVVEIASAAQLPLDEVTACFFDLLAKGLVVMNGAADIVAPAQSGVFERFTDEDTTK